MLKKILAFMVMLYAAIAMAAVDVNKATEAELDGIKGIGPVTSKLIMSELKKSPFKDWDDFISRVKGVGENRAAKLSADGLTVGSASYKPATVADKPITAKGADSGKAAADKPKEVAKTASAPARDAAKDTKDTKNTKDAKDTKDVKDAKDTVAGNKAVASKPAASAALPASAAKK